MKKEIYIVLFAALVGVGCGASNPSEAYLARLHAKPPQEQWDTIRKIGGLSPQQLAAQADAIQGASPDQRSEWKKEALQGAPGGPPQARLAGGPGTQNLPPAGVLGTSR